MFLLLILKYERKITMKFSILKNGKLFIAGLEMGEAAYRQARLKTEYPNEKFTVVSSEGLTILK